MNFETKVDLRIGTAAWSIPKAYGKLFPQDGTHLKKFAQVLNAVEINTSFYRDHNPQTYLRWADQVPSNFRFSVKLSKLFTHVRRCEDTTGLDIVLKSILGLGLKLGVVLVQLPPSLVFNRKVFHEFFLTIRETYDGKIAFEPRHLSWLEPDAQLLMKECLITQVIADPSVLLDEDQIKKKQGFQYLRLHGSPEIYKSEYSSGSLQHWIKKISLMKSNEVWVIFDNTKFGYATKNALNFKKSFELLGI